MNEIYWPLLTTIAPFQKYQLFLKQPGILSGTGQDLTVPRFLEIPPHSKELDKNWQKNNSHSVTQKYQKPTIKGRIYYYNFVKKIELGKVICNMMNIAWSE
jgi:hypothetical protein